MARVQLGKELGWRDVRLSEQSCSVTGLGFTAGEALFSESWARLEVLWFGWAIQVSVRKCCRVLCITLCGGCRGSTVAAHSEFFSLNRSGVNESKLCMCSPAFCSLSIPLNKERLDQFTYSYCHHPYVSVNCTTIRMCCFFPAREILVGQSVMKAGAASVKEQQLLLSGICR